MRTTVAACDHGVELDARLAQSVLETAFSAGISEPVTFVHSMHLWMRALSSLLIWSKPSMSSMVVMVFEVLHMRWKLWKRHSTWYQCVLIAWPDLWLASLARSFENVAVGVLT